MEIFYEYIPIEHIYLLGGLVFVLLIQIYFYFRYIRLPRRKQNNIDNAKLKRAGDQLDLFESNVRGVSVIIAARNESQNLLDFLPAVLDQDYPMFEVIVIDDGSEDNTRDILDQIALHYPRLHRSFVPKQARIISSKKLALSLGIKAARYDYLVFTDADCRPQSRLWLHEIMRTFDESEKNKVVLGFGAYFYRKGILNRLIQYDTLFNGLHYLGAARAKHPYMGVGRNMAYKKEWFQENNGFTAFLGEMAGDDDLLVNHNAKGTNTAIVTTPESITWSPPKETWKGWWQQKCRHLSVSPRYTLKSRIRLTAEPISRAIWYVLAGLLLWYGTDIIRMAVITLLLTRFIIRWIVMNVSAKRLGLKGVGLRGLIVWDIALPIISTFILILPHYRRPKRW